MIVTAILLAAATAAYVAYVANSPGGPQGGSVPGLLFGIAGSALMIYAGLLWARKKLPRWQVGSAQTWLRGHIWLGSLSVPIILFHAGFHLGGTVELALWVVLGAIVLSGVFGLALQQFLPRDLTSRVPLETFYDQVPHVCHTLQLEADVLIAALCGPLPIEPLAVATKESLAKLEVSGRDPLRSVYVLSPDPAAEGHAAKQGAAGGKTAIAGEKPVDVKAEAATSPAPAKQLSAADKIAAMKAAKKVTAPAPPAAVADLPAPPAASGGDAPTPATAKPLSAAEKIAAMRAAKSGVALAASATVATALPVEVAPPTEPATAPTETPASEPKPTAAKGMSAAEKIAAMRAAKPATAPESAQTPAKTPVAPESPANLSPDQPIPAKSSSAADKIAAMRAAKAAAPGAASPVTAVDAPPRPAATSVLPAKVAIVKTPKTSDAWKRSCPDLQRFYLDEVRPFLAPRYSRRSTLASASSGARVLATVKATLPAEMHAALSRIAELCEERRQLATQVRIHHWLHGWELVHVPLTLALLVLGVLHAITALYY